MHKHNHATYAQKFDITALFYKYLLVSSEPLTHIYSNKT